MFYYERGDIDIIDIRKNNYYTVYVHKNKVNEKCYVGITRVDVWSRWGTNGIHYKPYNNAYKSRFWNAINKYGFDNFEHIIIAEHLTKDEACRFEISLIKELKTQDDTYGYNISKGGDSPNSDNPIHGKNHYLSQQVYQYSSNGIFIKEWDCLNDINRMGYSSHRVKASIKNKCLYSGYYWAYFKYDFLDVSNLSNIESNSSESGTNKYDFVYQYDLQGNFIRKYTYKDLHDNNFDVKNVIRCCDKVISSYCDFLWSNTHNDKDIKDRILKYIICHKQYAIPVCQFSLDGQLIEKYDSIKNVELNNKNFNLSKIWEVCNNPRNKTHRGYIWTFDHDKLSSMGIDESIFMHKNSKELII